MRHSIALRVLLVVTLVASVLLPSELVFGKGEPEWKFLEGLRERNYHDMVLLYLDQMATSPRCPPDLKEVIDFEAGVELSREAKTIGTIVIREQYWDQARDRFQKFLSEHPRHKLSSDASMQLANVLVERGRMKAEQASRSKSADEKKALMAEAREKYLEAKKAFTTAEARAYETAKKFDKKVFDPHKDADKIEQANQARTELVQARLYLASVIYEIGKTYPKDSDEYKTQLTDAASRYSKLFKDHSSLGGGLYARMWEGRTYKDLGQTEKAIAIFREMLTLQDRPKALRLLKNKSLILLIETLTQPDQKKYQEAIDLIDKWGKNALGHEESSADGLRIHFLGGQSAFDLAKTLTKKDQKNAQKAALKTAKNHLQFVSKFQCTHRRDASEILRDPLFGKNLDDQTKPPKNYTEAKDRGDFAWGGFMIAMLDQSEAKTPEDLDTASKALVAARDTALKNYQYAVALKTKNVSIGDLNNLRYRLTILHWANEDYYRATLMGEFLARRYPDCDGARKGAEIGIKGYRTLFSRAVKQKESPDFEKRGLISLAKHVISLWPGSSESDEASMMLIDTAIDERELDQATRYLNNISEDSPKRIQAELRIGQALWVVYGTAANLPANERPKPEDLDKMLEKARNVLEKGISRMMKRIESGDEVTYSMARSVLVLAKVCQHSLKSEQAVRWLDDPKVGPMTLVKANAKVVDQPAFKIDTYKAALRAYVSAQEWDKSEESMNALEELVAADGDAMAVKKLTQEYIRIGLILQKQLTQLRLDGKTQEAAKVSKSFNTFLTRISERKEGNTFGSLIWVAKTFFDLGTGIDPGGKDPPKEAIEYYQKAGLTYGNIIKRIGKNPEFAPPGAAASIIVRHAACSRALHQHVDAINQLVKILRDNEKRLDVQIEAALTYQDWGLQRPGYFERAIYGGLAQKESDRTVIWGWSAISKRVAPFKEYRSVFHRARYNVALCHKGLAKAKSGAEAKKMYKRAELNIVRIYSLYPEMGGAEWQPKYDALLKDIQRALGKTPSGLSGLKKKSASRK